jgi:HK97 family phage major capsid protein
MANQLQEKAAVLEQKRAELSSLLKKSTNPDGEYNLNAAGIIEFNTRNEELTKLHTEFVQLKSIYDVAEINDRELKTFNQPADKLSQPGNRSEHKSLGDLIIDSGVAGVKKGATVRIPNVSVKTLMQESAGFAPEVIRNRPVLLSAQRPITLLDLIPMRDVTQTGLKYMEETTYTSGAAETSEAATYGEAALQFTEKSSLVKKIGVFLPVTDEQLDDVDYIRQYINDRLTYMLRARLEAQTVNGDGSAPNLTGILNFSGIQTQAKSTDPVFDAFRKAITKLQISPFVFPNIGVLHPTDLQNIVLTRTADGRYIMGDPQQALANVVLWGVPLTPSVVPSAGTAFLKDATFLEMAIYRGVDVQITNSHSDYFINGKQAIRADIRVAFHDYRPSSTCTVTGL